MLQVRDFLSLFLNYIIEQDVQKLLFFKLTLASFYQKKSIISEDIFSIEKYPQVDIISSSSFQVVQWWHFIEEIKMRFKGLERMNVCIMDDNVC